MQEVKVKWHKSQLEEDLNDITGWGQISGNNFDNLLASLPLFKQIKSWQQKRGDPLKSYVHSITTPSVICH